jgi:hypothetical protein
MAVARSLATAGRLTQGPLERAGITVDTVNRYFGSIRKLRALLGASIPRDKAGANSYTDAQLLASLAALASDLGRTPAHSDLRRYGMPSPEAYRNHFGSYKAACRAVGLDPNLPGVPAAAVDEVAVLVAYATHGDSRRVGLQLGLGQTKVIQVLAGLGCPPQPRGSRDTTERREWAADMARRLAGWPEPKEEVA